MEDKNRTSNGKFAKGHKGFKPKGATNIATREVKEKFNQLLDSYPVEQMIEDTTDLGIENADILRALRDLDAEQVASLVNEDVVEPCQRDEYPNSQNCSRQSIAKCRNPYKTMSQTILMSSSCISEDQRDGCDDYSSDQS